MEKQELTGAVDGESQSTLDQGAREKPKIDRSSGSRSKEFLAFRPEEDWPILLTKESQMG